MSVNMFQGKVKILLKETPKEAPKKVNQGMQSRFDLVPNLYQVSHDRQMVKEMLVQNVYCYPGQNIRQNFSGMKPLLNGKIAA